MPLIDVIDIGDEVVCDFCNLSVEDDAIAGGCAIFSAGKDGAAGLPVESAVRDVRRETADRLGDTNSVLAAVVLPDRAGRKGEADAWARHTGASRRVFL